MVRTGFLFDPAGRADDGSQHGRVAFRTDWQTAACDQVTVQGDWYKGTNGLAYDRPIFGFATDNEEVGGADILGRWSRVYSEDSDVALQFYYDRTDRINSGFDQDTNTIDIDFQHRFSPWHNHRLIWGLQYRNVWDRLKNTQTPAFISVTDQRRVLERASAFMQDEITLAEDKLYLTLGAKLSHNTYTHFEIQPSIRMLMLPTDDSALWAAVSRAVRTPTCTTEDLVLLGQPLPSPPFPANTPITIVGNRDVGSEELIAYEIGFRRQQTHNLSWDAAGFYNVYEDFLATRTVVPPLSLPVTEFFNGGSADVYGLEIASEWQVNCCWKIRAWYTYLNVRSKYDGSATQSPEKDRLGTPVNQAMVMSSWDVGRRVECDLITRYVDAVRFAGIPSYISMDLRLAWRPTHLLELSVVGQNLLDPHHPEYAGSPFTNEISTEVPRGIYGMATLRY